MKERVVPRKEVPATSLDAEAVGHPHCGQALGLHEDHIVGEVVPAGCGESRGKRAFPAALDATSSIALSPIPTPPACNASRNL